MAKLATSTISILWIRHGEKAYANCKGPNGCYQHDPGIIGDTSIIKERGKQLVDLYGIPAHCIVSPYRRTRETASLLLSSIDIKDRPEIRGDPSIAEYLGNQRPYLDDKKKISRKPLVEPATAKFEIPEIEETEIQLRERCQKHLQYFQLDDIQKEAAPGAKIVIWVVTHGIVIDTLYRLLTCQGDEWSLALKKHVSQTPWGSDGVSELDGFILLGEYGSGAHVQRLPLTTSKSNGNSPQEKPAPRGRGHHKDVVSPSNSRFPKSFRKHVGKHS